MATGGRIQHHLAQRLPNPKNLVLFIGFQAPGTRGRQIKDGEKEVKIFGQIIPCARRSPRWNSSAITPIPANCWSGCTPSSKRRTQTWLVHGEPDAAQKLREAMIKELHWNVNVAAWMQKVPLA